MKNSDRFLWIWMFWLGTANVIGAPSFTYKIMNTYAHDPSAFTQGLVMENGLLYEGTGQLGASQLRKIKFPDNKLLMATPIPNQFFGEGITIFKNKIFQLTWQSNLGFIYDKDTFEKVGEFYYDHEGWGITSDGSLLIVSDGSNILHFYEDTSFSEDHQIEVYDGTNPVYGLNELEYINGEIYANVWPTNDIVKIQPESGLVTGRIDLAGILGPLSAYQNVDVLNGIAYDQTDQRILVTGKYWPKMFEIEILPLAK